MTDLVNQTLKGYKLLELIGSGGSGVVYRALQPSIGREVAFKILGEAVTDQPEFIRRFDIESQLIARLEHLRIVPLYDFWRDPSGAYLVMRWMRGGSLAQLHAKGPWDLADAVRMLDQVAAGLDAAHNQRLIHRDIKPSNILLDEEGNAYLSDFGIAVGLPAPHPISSAEAGLAGTLDYISPEQARGEKLTPRADIYSLGMTLYEVLTGEHPFPGLNPVERLYKHINDPLPEIDLLKSDVADAVNQVIQTATAKDPGARFRTASEMAAALRAAARLESGRDSSFMGETLTPREDEILRQIGDGRTNKQIAGELFIELPTVKWHITQLYRKLGVRSRMQAVARARELGLLGTAGENSSQPPDSISISLEEPANPYKGLRPFEPADSRDFFGRKAVVDTLLSRLGEPGPDARFLAVVGPSGSGKSSLLGAGLVPAVWGGRLRGSERWFVVEMTPGARPFDELEVALTRIAADQSANLHEHLSRDAAGLLRAANLILPDDGSELFLVIDQFEELFTLIEGDPVRRRFLDLLTAAVRDPNSRVRVVIALRADFYDRPLNVPEFGELVNARMETLLPLSAADLEQAIVQPAGQVGVTLENGLSTQIIEDVLYQPGALPLLQYSLTELFDRKEDRLLTRRAYQEIGGAGGALANRAEEIYLQFDEGGRQATRQLFLRLVNLDQNAQEDGEPVLATRRRARRSVLRSLTAEPDIMDDVIETYGSYRMLSFDHEPATREPTVELAHEALLTEWSRLDDWVEESRADLYQHNRLQALAQEWLEMGEEPGFLLREARLDQVFSWAKLTDLVLSPDERRFLDASLEGREARREVEEDRQRRELEAARRLAEAEALRAEEGARSNRRLRLLTILLTLFLVAALAAAGLAIGESRRAANQARLAFARELTSSAVSALDDDPELSLLLARQAALTTYENDGTVLPETEAVIHQAIQQNRVVSSFPHGGGLAFSPDGASLATGGEDGSIVIWDLRTGEEVYRITEHTSQVTSLDFNTDGTLLASADETYQRMVWDLEADRPVLRLPRSRGSGPVLGANKVAFSHGSSRLLTTSPSEELEIWDVSTGYKIAHVDDSAGPDAAFSPDGSRLALTTAVWDVSSIPPRNTANLPHEFTWEDRLFDMADAILEIQAPSSSNLSEYQETGSVSFSPDGERIITTAISNLAVMVDARSGEVLFPLRGHSGVVHSVAFSPDGSQVATGSADGTARIWDSVTGEELFTLEGHQDEVIRVAFSPDGDLLATSSLDGSTKLWDLGVRGQGEIAGFYEHTGAVHLDFSSSGPFLASSGAEGKILLTNILTGNTRFSREAGVGGIQSIALSPDGSLLVVGIDNNQVQVVDGETGQALNTFQLEDNAVSISFNPGGDLLAVGTSSGDISIWDTGEWKRLGAWHLSDGFINGLVFSPDGDYLAAASFSGAGWILAVKDLLSLPSNGADVIALSAVTTELNEPAGQFTSLEWNPEGSKVVTTDLEGEAVVWNPQTGKPEMVLSGHHGQIRDAAFSPDGRRLVTAGSDGAILVWDAATGDQLYSLDQIEGGVRSVDFSGDGKYLAAGGEAGSVQVYLLPIDELIDLAQNRPTRELTDAECRRYLHSDGCP